MGDRSKSGACARAALAGISSHAQGSGVLRLHYFQSPSGQPNFGDELNPWLWPRLLPGTFDGTGPLFLGIGTILNQRLPKADRVVVFGSGAGLGEIPRLTEGWRVYCVRGPLTAEALGLPTERAITDPALFVRLFRDGIPSLPNAGDVFIPHYHHANPLWENVCARAGLTYLDPRRPVDEVLAVIAASRLVVAEAMHGAIVADALEVPWVAVRTTGRTDFKWRDWAASLELEHRPVGLPDLRRPRGALARLKEIVKRRLAERQLRRIASTGTPCLSRGRVRENKLTLLQQRLDELRADVLAGVGR